MSNILAFSFEQNQPIRAAMHEDGKPWFVAKDLAESLGYSETSRALEHTKHHTVLVELNRINNLPPATKWIPESDVYRVVMRSNLPAAEKFQDWVCEEVLPQIRKTGRYQPQPQLSDDEIRAKVLEVLRQEKRAEAASGYKRMMVAIESLPVEEEDYLPIKRQEANSINKIVLGMSANEFRAWYEVPPGDPIRENMAVSQLAAIAALEEANTTLLIAGMGWTDRHAALEKILSQRFLAVRMFRDKQLSLLDMRWRTKQWHLMPENPMESKMLAPLDATIKSLQMM